MRAPRRRGATFTAVTFSTREAGVRYTVPRLRAGWELSEETMPESVVHDEAVALLKALLLAFQEGRLPVEAAQSSSPTVETAAPGMPEIPVPAPEVLPGSPPAETPSGVPTSIPQPEPETLPGPTPLETPSREPAPAPPSSDSSPA